MISDNAKEYVKTYNNKMISWMKPAFNNGDYIRRSLIVLGYELNRSVFQLALYKRKQQVLSAIPTKDEKLYTTQDLEFIIGSLHELRPY